MPTSRKIFDLAAGNICAWPPLAAQATPSVPADRIRYLVHTAPAWTLVVVAIAAGITTLAVLAIGTSVCRRRGGRHRQ